MTNPLPPMLWLSLGALTTLLLLLWLVPLGGSSTPPASATRPVAPFVVTVVVAFPTETPTPSPTATRTPATTNTPWPTRPTCETPSPGDRCRNRELPTAVPTLTPKPPESWCEDIDLWIRKDQDCRWRTNTATPMPEPTPTPAVAPTSAPLPQEGVNR